MEKKKLELFVGRLGKEPELKYTATQKAICRLRVAVNDDDSTLWEDVIVWGKQAEICDQYLKKGSQIFVQGQRNQKTYNEKVYTEISAQKIGIVYG